MRNLLFLIFLVFTPFQGKAAQLPVTLCDGCNEQQRRAAAISSARGYGHALVGDRRTGYLYRYIVNVIGSHLAIPPGVLKTTASDRQAEEFYVYSEAYRAHQSSGVIVVDVEVSKRGGVLPPHFPNSAFDVTRDGAARTALIDYMSDTRNWDGSSSRLFYAKLIIEQGRSLMTGSDFAIRITSRFTDGSKVVLFYDSSKQALVFGEARDSVGNLIATSSMEPVQVDYSSYETNEASTRADYSRGLEWLRSHGVVTTHPSGRVSVRQGTVLVGGAVSVNYHQQQK
jgi:hypothetical protein